MADKVERNLVENTTGKAGANSQTAYAISRTPAGSKTNSTGDTKHLMQLFQEWFLDTTARDGAWATRARESFHYYTNNSWSAVDLKALNEQRRPALRLNQIRSYINVVLGIAIGQETNIRVTSEDPSKDETSIALSKLIRHAEARSDYDSIKHLAIRDGLIGGRGWREGYVDFTENPLGELKYRYVPSHHIKFDTNATHIDNIQYMFRAKWFSHEQFVKIFPGQAGSQNHSNGIFDSWQEEEVFAKGKDTDRRMVVEVWWKDIEKKHFTVDPQSARFNQYDTKAEATEAAQGLLAVISRNTRVIKTVTVTDDRFLTPVADSPYGNRVFPYFPFFPDNVQGVTDGLVEDMKDVQMMTNKVGSQVLHMVNQVANRSFLFFENSVDDEQTAVNQLNKSGGFVRWRGQKPEAMDPPSMPVELFGIWGKGDELFRLVSGITPAAQGLSQGSRESGKATQARQQASGNVLTPQMRAWHQSELLRAKWTIDAAQRVLTFPHILRVVGEDGNQETLELNQPQAGPQGTLEIMNDLSLGLYDVRLDNVPARTTMREENLSKLVDLRQAGAPIPTELIIEFMDGIPLELKQRLIKGIQQAAQAAAGQPGAQVQT